MASSFVASAAQQLGGLMANEFKHLQGVSDKIKLLRDDLRWMDGFLEDAYNKQHSNKLVAMWVDDVTDCAYEAQEIIEKYVHKVSHPRQNGSWNSIRWMFCLPRDAHALHEVGSDIDKLMTRMAKLRSRLSSYGVKSIKEEAYRRSSSTKSIWDQRQTYSHIKEDPIGLENQTRTVVEQLLMNRQVKVVGIHGMGGLGKTTLARQVFQDRETREHFKKLAWVCISKKFEARVVFRNILLELTSANERKELRDLTDGELPSKICEILTQNSCLVVLDDVWNNDDWNALKPAFDSISRSPSSKILITTRNNGLIQHGDSSEYCHNLNLLSDDDSWKLFRRIAFLEGVNSAESLPLEGIESDQTAEGSDSTAKQELGLKMLKHCKGLPLAIIALGGVLRNKKTIAEWEIVQKNITSYLMGDIEQGLDTKGLFAILELSYQDLPSYLKPCFMYLGVFPEDHVISTLKLYHLWEAEGLITNPTDGDEIQGVCLDDIAESYLNELVKRGLVQVDKYWKSGRFTKIRLHDVLRDMCHKKCKEANFLTIVKNRVCSSRDAGRKLRRCALYLTKTKSDEPPFDPSSNPAPYIVFQDFEPKKLFSPKMGKFFSLLRVLDHENSCDIIQQPKILKHFIHLRYLSFKRARFGKDLDIMEASLSSHIWECKFLETLDLRVQSWSVKLENKLWKLQRLRHLYLPRNITFEPTVTKPIFTDSQLQQMETLKNSDLSFGDYMGFRKMTSLRVVSFTYREISTEEVEHLLNSPMISERRLVKPLHLWVGADVINEGASLLAEIQSSIGFRELSVRGRIDNAAVNLEILDKIYLTKLCLGYSEIDQQGISVLEKLPHLKEVELGGKAIAGSQMRFREGSFPKLEELRFVLLWALEEWETEEGALPNLQLLFISQCDKLKMIPQGLPKSVFVECVSPCVSGVDNYNVCPYATYAYEENKTLSASVLLYIYIAKLLFAQCTYRIRTGNRDFR